MDVFGEEMILRCCNERLANSSTKAYDPGVSSDSGRFKIALFADLHYGENSWTEWGPAQDVKSEIVMSGILDAEKPDFVVYLGDVVTANNIAIRNASLYWEKALSPARNRGIPMASVFGNHDDMAFEWPSEWFSSSSGVPELVCTEEESNTCSCSFGGTSRSELMINEIENNNLSYSRCGPSNLLPGVSNYILPVHHSYQTFQTNNHSPPLALLYFLDSGGGSYPEIISNAQVNWFRAQSNHLNPEMTIPELVFWHIPSLAYKKVAPPPSPQQDGLFGGIGMHCVGSINYETVDPQEAELGIMDLLSKRPSVKAVFVGHNHGLDWCCPWRNLWLCFARHTGYGGYGNWTRGARMVQITEHPFSLSSWIRMEDGTSRSHFHFDMHPSQTN